MTMLSVHIYRPICLFLEDSPTRRYGDIRISGAFKYISDVVVAVGVVPFERPYESKIYTRGDSLWRDVYYRHEDEKAVREAIEKLHPDLDSHYWDA